MPNYLIAANLQTYLQISKGYFKNFCRFSEAIIDVDADFLRLFFVSNADFLRFCQVNIAGKGY